MPEGIFILTITKDIENSYPSIPKSKVHIKRKSVDLTKNVVIYSFTSFDEICSFCEFINKSSFIALLKKQTVSLYSYDNHYYLCFKNLRGTFEELKGFCSALTEFGLYVDSSDLFERKLKEYGKRIISKNAIGIILEKFCKIQ